MAVKVNISRSSTGTSQERAAHDNGYSVTVKDGHLFVYDARDNTIAAYAPTQWTDVTVDNDSK